MEEIVQRRELADDQDRAFRHLTEDLIARGQLVRPVAESLRTAFGYYIVWPRGVPLTGDAAIACDWLQRQARP